MYLLRAAAAARRASGPDIGPIFAGRAGGYYDPSLLSSVFQDSAGTTPGAVNSVVGRINDLTGNGNHLIQTTTAAKPILRFVGGVYYLEFDGVDDCLDFINIGVNFLSGWTQGAGFMAVQVAVEVPAGNCSGVFGYFAPSGSGALYPSATGNINGTFLSSTAHSIDPGVLAAWHTADESSIANDYKLGFNNVDVITDAANVVQVTSNATHPRIGQNGWGNPPFAGKLARFGFIDRSLNSLTAPQKLTVRNWCAASYGVTF